jgi:hypothetical protein
MFRADRVWSAQYNHLPAFRLGKTWDAAMDHDRYCVMCGDTLPPGLPYDDPCDRSLTYIVHEEEL